MYIYYDDETLDIIACDISNKKVFKIEGKEIKSNIQAPSDYDVLDTNKTLKLTKNDSGKVIVSLIDVPIEENTEENS